MWPRRCRCTPRSTDPSSAGFFPEWPTVEPIDDVSFTLRTKRPVPVLDYLMSNILITPAAANKPEDLSGGVGTGPYVVTQADRGSGTYTLARSEKYWGTAPHVESVRVRFMPDESSRVVALRSGEIDVIDSITPDSTDQIDGLAGVAVQHADGVRLNQLFYNFRKPAGSPMADARVRRALTYAIDGQSLIDNVMQGSATASRGVIPLSLAGAIETGSYTYDPDRTKSELRSLGINDLRVKIIWESGEFAADTDIMESVVQMLSAAGVNATLQQFEPGGDIATVAPGQGRRLGHPRQRLSQPHRPGPDDHAGHVRRHRGEGSHPRQLPRLRLPGDHQGHHRGLGGSRPGPPRCAAGRRAASHLGDVPDDVVLRPQGGPGPAHPHRRNQLAPHQLL